MDLQTDAVLIAQDLVDFFFYGEAEALIEATELLEHHGSYGAWAEFVEEEQYQDRRTERALDDRAARELDDADWRWPI